MERLLWWLFARVTQCLVVHGELRGWYALAYLAASVDATPRRTSTLSFRYG
jgi:hypothetical protein